MAVRPVQCCEGCLKRPATPQPSKRCFQVRTARFEGRLNSEARENRLAFESMHWFYNWPQSILLQFTNFLS
jgi:hypothetical protein